MSVLWVVIGASVGAPLRWWIDTTIQRRWGPRFPWGTFTVNVFGSFLLGFLVASHTPGSPTLLFLGVGLCGSLTTFSSFAWETLQLAQGGAKSLAVSNVLVSLAMCIGAAALGWSIATSAS